MTYCNTIWYDMIWHDMTWHDIICYDMIETNAIPLLITFIFCNCTVYRTSNINSYSYMCRSSRGQRSVTWMSKGSPEAHGADIVGRGGKPFPNATISGSGTLQLKKVAGVPQKLANLKELDNRLTSSWWDKLWKFRDFYDRRRQMHTNASS